MPAHQAGIVAAVQNPVEGLTFAFTFQLTDSAALAAGRVPTPQISVHAGYHTGPYPPSPDPTAPTQPGGTLGRGGTQRAHTSDRPSQHPHLEVRSPASSHRQCLTIPTPRHRGAQPWLAAFRAARAQLAAEVGHWHAAVHTLSDLDARRGTRGLGIPGALPRRPGSYPSAEHRRGLVPGSRPSDVGCRAGPSTAADLARLRHRLLDIRRRYLQAEETVIDFYGEAVENTRTTPKLGRLLRGLDSIAVDSMDALLRPRH